MKYYINRNEAFTGLKQLEVEYDYPPPCLYCNRLVESPSTDGPLVCGWCDMGCNSDGSKWTEQDSLDRHANFKRRIEEIIN
jgi:hypothetical protein